MSLYIYLKHGCCPRTACSVTFPGASVYASPRRRILPAVHLCGPFHCVCCVLHGAAEQSRSVPLMSRVVIRALPWWNTCRGPGWGKMLGLDFQTVCPGCSGARLEHHGYLCFCSEDAQCGSCVPHRDLLPARCAWASGFGLQQHSVGRPLEVWSSSAPRAGILVSKDLMAGGAPWRCWNPLHTFPTD